jgi:hypothetical protein
MYFVYEYAKYTLKDVVFSPIFPTKIQLASIMSQVSYFNYHNTVLIFCISACWHFLYSIFRICVWRAFL